MAYLKYTALRDKNIPVEGSWNEELSSGFNRESYRVFLLYPTVKHYAGSIFQLLKPRIPALEETEEIVLEKEKFRNKPSFYLPDGGSGRPVWLPVDDVRLCPPEFFIHLDLKSGPVRITSINLNESIPVSYTPNLYAIPDGFLPFTLIHDDAQIKNTLSIDSTSQLKPIHVQVWDLVNERIVGEQALVGDRNLMSLRFLEPGCYTLRVKTEQGVVCVIQLIKLFPVYVEKDKRGQYRTMPSLW